MRVAGFLCAVPFLIASFLAANDTAIGTNGDASGASGASRPTSAFIPPGPGQPGRVDLEITGSGFTDEVQTVSITGPVVDVYGKVIGDDVADSVAITLRNSTRLGASLILKTALSPAASYTVHLLDKNGKELSSASLDLEYVVRYRALSNLGLETPATTAGDSWLGALQKRHEAKKIERQTAANERLIAAKMKAAEVQRQMYLFDHPGVSPQGQNRFSTSGQPSDVVPTADPYCMADSAAESTYIRVRRSVVDPKEASDSYGRRLGRRFIVFEVTVENNNPNLQYMLHDVSVDLSRLHNVAPGTYRWAFSSQDLIMLRGVPEKGSDYDPRNLTFHILRGTGAVAGGVTGLTAAGIQDLYGGVTAAYNGPLLSSFIDIFPDHTATELNRLSDSAFTANTVVPKQSAKTFAIFVPEDVFLTHSEQNAYWKEPTAVFDDPGLDFRQADVCVDGAFITEVPALTLTAATYDNADAVKAGADAPITITGSSLSVGDTIVDAFNTRFSVTSADSSGATAHATLNIPSDWSFSVTPQIALESKGTGYKTPPLPLGVPPLLTTAIFAWDSSLIGGSGAHLELTGDRMSAGDTELLFNGNEVAVSNVQNGTSADAQVVLPSPFDASKEYPLSLKSKTSGATSKSVSLSIPSPSLQSATSNPVAAANPTVILSLTGGGFIRNDTLLEFSGSATLEIPVSVTADGKATATIQLPKAFNASSDKISLKSKLSGNASAPAVWSSIVH